jgi:hypothetical protein
MNETTITSQQGSKMTYKWNSIWEAELFTFDGRLKTRVKFRVKAGSTPADVLAKIEEFKGGRGRTFKAEGVCSMTKRTLQLPLGK